MASGTVRAKHKYCKITLSKTKMVALLLIDQPLDHFKALHIKPTISSFGPSID